MKYLLDDKIERWIKRIEANSSGFVDLPSPKIDFYATAGDYIILTMERENATLVANVIASFEMGEEI